MRPVVSGKRCSVSGAKWLRIRHATVTALVVARFRMAQDRKAFQRRVPLRSSPVQGG